MNYKFIGNVIGRILCVEAAVLVPAVGVSLFYREFRTALAILISAAVTAVAGLLLLLPKAGKKNYYAREGFVSVGLAWIVISLFGALPFFLDGAIPNFLDCVFETISGFTTTGASILTDVEALPRGLLYWRSFTHWLGGMGVLVFLLALHPMTKGKGQSMYLMRAESPGPEVAKLVPKVQKSAMILYGIYCGLTLLQILLQALGGMPLFDNITTAFGTAGTGGFGIKADSIAGYSPYLQVVVTVFMALFGVNFGVYYLFLARKPLQALKSTELRIYVAILVISTALITVNILPQYSGVGESLRHAAFQVSSIMTTTGFATTNFDLWPEFSKAILLMLMVVGACAGSTGGGIKVSRVLLMLKAMKREHRRTVSPKTVSIIKLDGKVVDNDTLSGIWFYMTAYSVILVGSVLAVSLNNFGLETTISSVVACLNTIGPGFGVAGPMGGYADFSPLSKVVLCLNMLLGRLEIFPLLMLCAPISWRKSFGARGGR